MSRVAVFVYRLSFSVSSALFRLAMRLDREAVVAVMGPPRSTAATEQARAALGDPEYHEHIAGDKHSHPFSGPHSHGGVSALAVEAAPPCEACARGDRSSHGQHRAVEAVRPETDEDAKTRAAVEADPWSFKEGTLLERLEWCRWQHKIAADLSAQGQPSPEPKTPPDNARWHFDCVAWYDGMIRDLKANENLR